jgi:hypothetical protein
MTMVAIGLDRVGDLKAVGEFGSNGCRATPLARPHRFEAISVGSAVPWGLGLLR